MRLSNEFETKRKLLVYEKKKVQTSSVTHRDELNFILGTRTLTQRLTTRVPIYCEFQTIVKANVISI